MKRHVTVTLSLCGVVLLGMTILAPPLGAYPTFSKDKISHPAGSSRCRTTDTDGCEESFGFCKACHGHFRATDEENSRPMLRDQYVSPADDKVWREIYTEVTETEPVLEVGLHDIHRHIMVDKLNRSRCSVCHLESGRYPVILDFSATTELEPLGCVGCHGRWEDQGADSGFGAGLRQHHTNAGVYECKTCHFDADPANYTTVGEDVPPPNYFTPDAEFPNKPTDPCNAHGEEDYAGGPRGLDNDGDGIYDKADPDCRPIGAGRNHGRVLREE